MQWFIEKSPRKMGGGNLYAGAFQYTVSFSIVYATKVVIIFCNTSNFVRFCLDWISHVLCHGYKEYGGG